jgi:hypothetical protein
VQDKKEFTLTAMNFFTDLVLIEYYNAFVIVENQTNFTHQDIGQLQMYVNYYDRVENYLVKIQLLVLL